jgi:uncharacterized protein (DUF885 family)
VSEVFDIADRYCTQLGALDPCSATGAGIPGHDHEMTDFSPEGSAQRTDLARATLAALITAPEESDDDRLAASVITERLSLDVDQFDAGERLRDVRIIGSPIEAARQCFDLMRLDTDDDWDVATERMTRVPASLESIEASLRVGVEQGLVAARRQALACAEMAATWGGEGDDEPFFRSLGTRASRRTCATSTHPLPTRAIRWAAIATRSSRAPSTASISTSKRRTRGDGRSCTGSRTRCVASQNASFPVHPSTR